MNSKPIIAGTALLGVLGIGVVFQTLTGGDEAAESQEVTTSTTVPLGSSEPSGENPVDEGGTQTSPGASGEPDPGQETTGATSNEADPQLPALDGDAAAVAEAAMIAYTQYSYADPSPTSWIDRVAAYGTEGFHHNLEELFGGEDPYWEDSVVPDRRETRTTVEAVEVSGMHEQSAEKVVYTVTYENAIKTKDMADFGDADPMTMWVYLVKQGGEWKVSDITPTGARSDGAF